MVEKQLLCSLQNKINLSLDRYLAKKIKETCSQAILLDDEKNKEFSKCLKVCEKYSLVSSVADPESHHFGRAVAAT
jgi:spore coat polysaccharide biosynthesis predicted glycosyltransferase SpsG